MEACNCVELRRGSFLLMFTLWIAYWAGTWSGIGFWSHAYRFWTLQQGYPPIPFAAWLIMLVIGCHRACIGVRAALRDGDTVHPLTTLAFIFTFWLPLHVRPYFLEDSIGAVYFIDGLLYSAIAYNVANIALYATAKWRRQRLITITITPPTGLNAVVAWKNSVSAVIERNGGRTALLAATNARFTAVLNELREMRRDLDQLRADIAGPMLEGHAIDLGVSR